MQEQILIAGGGIGGLAAALAATRAGTEVRLFERSAAFSEVGAGVQLSPNVVRRLQAWGLQKPLQAAAAFPQALVSRNAISGQALARLDLGAQAVARYGAAYATIHRADLHQLLRDAVKCNADLHLNLDNPVDYHEDNGRVVTITTKQGKQIEGDALIGADGIWSRTRLRLLHDAPPRVTGHLAYRALVPQADLPAAMRTDVITAWMGPRFHAVQYPVRGGELQNLVVIVEGAAPEDLEHWNHAANGTDLQRCLAGAHRQLLGLVDAVNATGTAWRLWPLADRTPMTGPHEMAQDLVALLGDAAHPMRPYLAQGAGMAIEDAAELQRALTMHDLELPLRLRRYALNRWQRNARVQARAIRNGEIFHARGLVALGRDTALRALGAKLMDVPWLYRGDGSSASVL
ncbi:FAD-dependent monooxygenase [Comamonas piscis]